LLWYHDAHPVVHTLCFSCEYVVSRYCLICCGFGSTLFRPEAARVRMHDMM
jgi:hypothetical protein